MFRSGCISVIAGGSEVVGASVRAEGAHDGADGRPQAIDTALGGLAQDGLELGKGVLDRIEVGVAGRQPWLRLRRT
jgi:hypothetical protein